MPGDLREEAFCTKLMQDAVSGLGGLDIVVCNAGRQETHASILDIPTEQFHWTMKTNIYTPFWIIKAALPHLQPSSAIIGTKSLAKQLGPKGIRVNGVAPGPIWTPLQVSGGAPIEKLKQFGSDTALGRPGQPAGLASFHGGSKKHGYS